MFSDIDTPDEEYWVEVDGDRRTHPYAMHRTVNQDEVEVVSSISDDDNHPKRWVIVRDGEHEVWVQVAELDTYGYELQPDEQVSDAELEAISLKQAAMRDEWAASDDASTVSVDEAQELVDAGEPDQVGHALVALYYAAKTDPDVPEEDVDDLREIVHEHTDHVDTSHVATVEGILDEVRDDDDPNTDT